MARQTTAERIASYLARHPGADWNDPDPIIRKAVRDAARGHGGIRTGKPTPEHGQSYAAHYPGMTTYLTRSAQEAKRLLTEAAHNGQRVSVAVNDKFYRAPGPMIAVWENWRKGGATGIGAEWLLRGRGNPAPIGAQNLRTYLEATTFGSQKYNNLYQPSGISWILVTVYHK